jgi:hypothetical protein
LRIPGSINSKYGNTKVTIVQRWNGIKPPIPREFVEEFRIDLIQKKIDEANNKETKNTIDEIKEATTE